MNENISEEYKIFMNLGFKLNLQSKTNRISSLICKNILKMDNKMLEDKLVDEQKKALFPQCM